MILVFIIYTSLAVTMIHRFEDSFSISKATHEVHFLPIQKRSPLMRMS